ncbi:MAG TPA: extracellular solute-binding protein, partial [Ilumatobacteraceae bacterium]
QSEARRLASAAVLLATSEPNIAMRVALESLDASARAGAPGLLEAEEALHWALQEAQVPYPRDDYPVEVRSGPDGPTGIYRMPIEDLAAMALARVSRRSLTPAECGRVNLSPCPTHASASWPAVPTEVDRPPLPDQADRPLAGTTIRMVEISGDVGLQDELAAFEERTGIRVERELGWDESADEARRAGRDLLVTYTGAVSSNVRAGGVVDLSTYVDVGAARRAFGDRLVDVNTVDDGLYGMPMMMNATGVVFYPLEAFDAAGYEVPDTWDGLIALSQQIVADGRTPWCIGLDTDFPGTPATDWVEALVLRSAGPTFYERWMRGEVPFTDRVVHDAVARFGDLAFAPGFVRNGSAAISRTSDDDARGQLGLEPPGCWLNFGFSWRAGDVHRFTDTDLGYFVLPPLEPGGPAPLSGSADVVQAVADRPEVREFVRLLLDPEWGALWASDADGGFVSANTQFDDRNCRSPDVSDAANDMRIALCETQRTALASGNWYLDASMHMASNVGLFDLGAGPDAFAQAMIDYVDGGPAVLDEVLAEIDAASG